MLPAVKPSPPALRTQPERSPLLSVTQGCFVVLENSSWNLVSSASIQRSLPYGNLRVSTGDSTGEGDTHDVVARHVRVTGVDEQTNTVLD